MTYLTAPSPQAGRASEISRESFSRRRLVSVHPDDASAASSRASQAWIDPGVRCPSPRQLSWRPPAPSSVAKVSAQFGVELAVRALFEQRTLAELASAVTYEKRMLELRPGCGPDAPPFRRARRKRSVLRERRAAKPARSLSCSKHAALHRELARGPAPQATDQQRLRRARRIERGPLRIRSSSCEMVIVEGCYDYTMTS
jgi:hypothetical protein